MSNVKEAIASEAAMTITLNSLASSTAGAGQESTVVDNSSNLYLDALVSLTIAWTSASSAANDKAVYVFAHGSTDGSTYIESLTGSNASFTIPNDSGALKTTLRLIGTIVSKDTTTTSSKRYGGWSVAQAFGGILPVKWGIVVLNVSGIALASSGCTAQYCGVYQTVI